MKSLRLSNVRSKLPFRLMIRLGLTLWSICLLSLSVWSAGENCSNPYMLACGSHNSSTLGGGNDWNIGDYPCHTSSSSFNGEDRVYKLNLPKDDWYFITLSNLTADLDIFLMWDICNGTSSNSCLGKSTRSGTSTEQIGPIYLRQFENIYVIVDGYHSSIQGNYRITLTCYNRPSPSACRQSYNFRGLSFHENFEIYNTGNISSQSTIWKKYASTSADASVSNTRAYTGSKSLRVQRGTTSPDVLLPFGNLEFGRYRLTWKMYVVNGSSGYYNLQHNKDGGHWAYEVRFNSTGQGTVEYLRTTQFNFNFPRNQWFSCTQIIDIDENIVELYINGEYVGHWTWSHGTVSGGTLSSKKLGAINFFANTGNHYYVDDICMYRTGCLDCVITPLDQQVCLYEGNTYRSACFAECAGYTDEEWNIGNCECICPLIYSPVCAGGKTYSNSCVAQCDGHTTWTPGACVSSCTECFQCFTWRPRTANELVFYQDYCTDESGTISYEWTLPSGSGATFIDGTNKNSKNPICRFPNSGTFNVCYKVFRGSTKVYECCKKVTIGTCTNEPEAFFTFTYNSSTQEYTLDGTVSKNASGYEWDYGGGSKSGGTDSKPRVKFTSGKCYTVCLTIYNACGSSKICKTFCPGASCTSDATPPTHSAPIISIEDDELSISGMPEWDKTDWSLSSGLSYATGYSPTSRQLKARFGAPGYYLVCVVATKGCHRICYCFPVYYPGCCITEYDKVTFEFGQVCGTAMTEIDVPVKVYNFSNITGASYTIRMEDTMVGQIIGFSTVNLFSSLPSFYELEPGEVWAFSWVNNDGLTYPDGTTLFNLRVKLKNIAGQTSNIIIDNEPVPIAVYKNALPVDYYIRHGSVCIGTPSKYIEGEIISYSKEKINNADVILIDNTTPGISSARLFITGGLGFYRFNQLGSGRILTVECHKSNDIRSGLDIGDLIAIQNHIAGRAIFSRPEQYVAADVNHSGSINSTDVQMLQQVILGAASSFGMHPSWVFIPTTETLTTDKAKNHTYRTTYIFNPFSTNASGRNFYGIKIGDVNFNTNYQTIQNNLATRQSYTSLSGPDLTASVGTTLQDPLTIQPSEGLRAITMEVHWDESVVKLEDVNTFNLALPGFNEQALDYSRLDQGVLTITWIGEQEVTNLSGHTLLNLNFRTIGPAGAYTDIRFGDPRVYDDLGFETQAQLKDGSIHITPVTSKSIPALLFPNPARNMVNIQVYEPTVEVVELLNVLGQSTKLHWKGQTQYQMDVNHLAPGMYYVVLQKDGLRSTHPLIIKTNR